MQAHAKVSVVSVALVALIGCAASKLEDTGRKARAPGAGGDLYDYVPSNAGGSGAQAGKAGASAAHAGSGARAGASGASSGNGAGVSGTGNEGAGGAGNRPGQGGNGGGAGAAGAGADCPSLTLARTGDGTCVARVVEYDVAKNPTSIVLGSDGRIWVDDADSDQLLQLDEAGRVIDRVSGDAGSSPRALVAGSGDAILWYTEARAKTLVKVNRNHERVVMPVGFEASALALGADGEVFVTEFGKAVYRARPEQLSLTRWESSPTDAIVVGPDNLVWFSQGSVLSQLSPTAGVTDFLLAETAYASGLCVGADAGLWFSDGFANQLVRVSSDGTVSRIINLPTGTAPGRIIKGPDDAFWFVETGTSMIGRVTLKGEITHYPLPTPDSLPDALTLGPNDDIWFTAISSRKVGRLLPDRLP